MVRTPSASEFLVPAFQLNVNGAPLPPEAYNFINSVEWEQDFQMVDELTINCDNTGFQFSDTNLFEFGGEVELLGGYKNLMIPMTKGIIERWLPNFPKSDTANLIVKAYHPARVLMEEDPTSQRSFRGMTDTEIVRTILTKRGLNFDTSLFQAVPPVRRRFKRSRKKGEKDLEFIKRLARLHNFEFWVDYDHIKRMFVAHWELYNEAFLEEPTLFYKIGIQQSNIDSVAFEIATPGQNNQIEVIGWDPRLGRTVRVLVLAKPGKRGEKAFTGIVEDAKQALTYGHEIVTTTWKKRYIKVLSGQRFENEQDAINYANQVLRDEETAFSEITVNMPGLPEMRNRQVYMVAGLGKRLSGRYYLKTVRHKFEKGDDIQYNVEFVGKGIVETTPIDPATGKPGK